MSDGSYSLYRPVASQPGGGGGSELGWVEHQAHPPPLGHCPRDVINLKNAPTLGHSQAPPPWTLDIVRVTSSALRKIGKHHPLGHSQAPPPLDIARVTSSTYLDIQKHPPPFGHCPCDVIHIFQGWTKIAKGWTKIAKGWNKIAKGWNKIAKGWNKIFGMGNWGGGRPTPRPPWLRACYRRGYKSCIG